MGLPKLFQWLFGVGAFTAIWFAHVAGYVQCDFAEKHPDFVLLLPVLLVGLFGLYSVAVIAYRVATFNDCVEASEELKQQMKEAQEDLKKKGFKFASDWEES